MDRQPCCRVVNPTTHSGAVCRGAAAAWLNPTCRGLAGGLGEWEKIFSQWHFCNPPQASLCPSFTQRALRGQGEARPPATAPSWAVPMSRGAATALPRHGAMARGCGCHHRVPHTAAAVTPTCSHISHTNRSLHRVLIQFVAVSITTSQRFLVLSVAVWMLSFGLEKG